MRRLILAAAIAAPLVATWAAPALAQSGMAAMPGMNMPEHAHAAAETGRAGTNVASPDVVVQVNGLVCDFCAKGLEKSFNRTGKVSGVSVDLTARQVRLKFKSGAGLDDAQIRKLIRDAGYALVSLTRAPA